MAEQKRDSAVEFVAASLSAVCEPAVREAVEQYIQTGERNPLYSTWPGNLLERAERGHDDLRGGLISAVKQRVAGLPEPPVRQADSLAITRAKVEPMTRGLFPLAEQDAVLGVIERSVLFVTSANLQAILRS